MRPLLLGILGAVAGVAAALAGPPPTHAADITVTTTVDEITVNGECSLREAVLAANTNLAVDACVAGTVELDILQLQPGRYTLAIAGAGEDAAVTGDLDLVGETAIRGEEDSSPNATQVDGGGLDRVFDVHGLDRVSFELLTITGGAAGAEDGGGIRVVPTTAPTAPTCPRARHLLINRVVVRGNAAGRGGGIFMGTCSQLETEWSSIADNTATAQGGGIAGELVTSVIILESTLSANGAVEGGGLWMEGNPFQGGLFFSTVAHNAASAGGGISIGPAVTSAFVLNSTIVAYNGGGDCQLANPVTVIYTLATDETCGSPGGGNLPSTDPLLQPRDDDPVAYRLGTNSPAIDAGEPQPAPCTHLFSDQFSSMRPLDGDGDGVAVCDMGSSEAPAVEADPSPSPIAPQPSSRIDPVGAAGGGLPNTAAEPTQGGTARWFLVLMLGAIAAAAVVSHRRATARSVDSR